VTWAVILIGDKVWSDVMEYEEALKDAKELADQGHVARVFKLVETHYYKAVPK